MAIATQGTASNYLQRAPSPSGLADVVELILDKGLVIDAYVRIAVIGIEVITIDARIVIASVDTYLRFAEAGQSARPDRDRARRPSGAPGEGRRGDDRRRDRRRRGQAAFRARCGRRRRASLQRLRWEQRPSRPERSRTAWEKATAQMTETAEVDMAEQEEQGNSQDAKKTVVRATVAAWPAARSRTAFARLRRRSGEAAVDRRERLGARRGGARQGEGRRRREGRGRDVGRHRSSAGSRNRAKLPAPRASNGSASRAAGSASKSATSRSRRSSRAA